MVEVEHIEHEGKKLGYIIRNAHNIKGREFPGHEEDFMQIGILNLKKGEWVEPHIHKDWERKINKTHKAIYVISGKMKIHFYYDKKKIKEIILNAGDIINLKNGGFGFESLENETKIVEVKQGPYPGLEYDKEKFNPIENE